MYLRKYCYQNISVIINDNYFVSSDTKLGKATKS